MFEIRKTEVLLFMSSASIGVLFTYGCAIAEEKPSYATALYELTRAVDTMTAQSDGTFEIEWDREKTLLDESGRDGFSQQSFTFNDQLSSLDVLDAETIKKDGRRISVKPEQIRLQEDPEAIGSPVFTTSKVKTIIFPDIEVGDHIHFRVRKIQREAPLPGNFSYTDWFFPEEQVGIYKFILNTPQSLKLQIDQQEMSEEATEHVNGRTIRSWTYTQPNPRSVDGGKANMLYNEPHFLVSSFSNWQDLADAYQGRASDKVLLTPEIQKLAAEITFGETDTREQTHKLYDWVRSNIRYVAIYLADGGYVPHSSEDILHNRYGDCKDHVILLEALLRAKDISSYGVIISDDTNFLRSPIPTPDAFDHVITYIPKLNLFLDSTQQYLPFGELGFRISSKPSLNLGGSRDIDITPDMRAEDNKRTTTTKLSLQLNGAFSGSVDEQSSGAIGLYVRSIMASVSPLKQHDFVSQVLSAQGLKGSGTLTFDPPVSAPSDYHTLVDFNVSESGLDFSHPEATVLAAPIAIGDQIATLTSFAYAKADPQFPTLCMASDLTDNYEVSLPKGTSVIAMPHAVDVTDGPISYSATYRHSGDKIFVSRHYRMMIEKGFCTPQEIAQMTSVAKVAQKDLASKLMLAPQ